MLRVFFDRIVRWLVAGVTPVLCIEGDERGDRNGRNGKESKGKAGKAGAAATAGRKRGRGFKARCEDVTALAQLLGIPTGQAS